MRFPQKRNATTWVAEEVKIRFSKKYKVLPNGCWEWIGTQQRRYGALKMANGTQRRAHRLSYELFKGPIPADAFILHSCDFRLCVNPDHLYLGTHKRNMADMKERLGGALGSRNYNSKLTDDKVRELRRLFGTMPIEDLAAQFKVTPAAACMAICRYTWRHVP